MTAARFARVKPSVTLEGHLLSLVSGVLAALLLGLAPTITLGAEASAPDEQPAFQYDPAGRKVAASVWGNPREYDADALFAHGRHWFAWLEFTPGEGDALWVGSGGETATQWSRKVRLKVSAQEFAAPTLTAAENGQVWLTYEARIGDQWDVFAVQVDRSLELSPARPVSESGTSDVLHKACPDQDGIWVAWQSDRAGQYDICVRRVGGAARGPVMRVSKNPLNDWHPAVAVTSDGRLCVAWDAFNGDSNDVVARFFTAGNWSDELAVAAGPQFEGRVDLAADRVGRVWLAWEEGSENWGRAYRGIEADKVRDAAGPLHRHREIRIAAIEPDNSLMVPVTSFPMPSVEKAMQRDGRPAGVDRMGAFYERPRILLDRSDRLWICYRHYFTPWLGIAHRTHVESGWGVYVRYLDAGGWSDLYRFAIGQGDGMQRLELAQRQDEMFAIWTTGRTDRNPSDRPRGVATAVVAPGQTPSGATALRPHLSLSAANYGAAPTRRDVRREVAGTEYHLVFGDLHRHTDFSLCRVPLDGTLDDAYRYAVDVAGIDFLAITDHSRDIARGDALSLLWRRSSKEVYRRQLVDGESLRFFPYYAYERSHSHTADHNVISLRSDMLRPYDYPIPEFWGELDDNTLTIPHQPIRRDTWSYQDDRLRPLLEIYQGCRDQSIEGDAHQGLEKGYHLGFIASSDHMSTSASFAGVWTTHRSRQSVFDALRARRTFAATARIELAVLAGGQHWMGEVISAADEPVELTLTARGTAPIRTVRFVVDGKMEDVEVVGQREVQLERTFNPAGRRYAYFHLEQIDGNEAWSSPIWFGTDEAVADYPGDSE